MANVITDGDFTVAAPISDIRFSAPIPGVATQYIAQQDFVINRINFSPIAIGTAHPSMATFFLQQETPMEPTPIANIMTWTRIYAAVPATHSLPTAITYNFIGFYGTFGVNATTITGRDRFQKTVAARVQFDYYRVGTGLTYATIFDVPVLGDQKYYYSTTSSLQVDFLADAPPFTAASNPSRTAYLALITAGTEIVAKDSELELWNGIGNIVRRQTVYIKPQ